MIAEVLLAVLNINVLLFIFLGVASGICIGALPGLTATMGIALMLPLTFGMSAAAGMLLLIGVYIGAIYGGSISAILLRTPGTPASAATALDGYEFSKRGESERAIKISTLSSFIGGMVSCIMLILIAPRLSKIALTFSSPEFFMLAIFGLSIIANVSGKSLLKGILAGAFGFMISVIGIDTVTGFMRFTYGNVNLLSGLSYIPIMIGLFALSEVFNISGRSNQQKILMHSDPHKKKLSKDDLKKICKVAPISGLIGTIIGIIPGAGADIGAFVSYNEAKRFSKKPEKFGTGITEGVAAAEGGNNGVTGGALIPMLTLGIPGDSVAAIMIGALTIQGLQPGPLLFQNNSLLVYTIFAGFIVANIFMLVLGFSGVRVFSKILAVPRSILSPVIVMLCFVGAYAINSSLFDVGVMMIFGVIGFFMQKAGMPVSPVVLGIILGPLAESHFRRALLMGNGSPTVFFQSPVSLLFFILTVLTLFWPLIRKVVQIAFVKRPPVN